MAVQGRRVGGAATTAGTSEPATYPSTDAPTAPYASSMGFRLALRRSCRRVEVPVHGAGGERCGLLRPLRVGACLPYVVGTSPMTSRYGLAVPLATGRVYRRCRRCGCRPPRYALTGVHVLVTAPAGRNVTPFLGPVGAVQVPNLVEYTLLLVDQVDKFIPAPPRLDRFRVGMALCLSAKKMFGDPSGPLSPPRWPSGCPRCPRYMA